MRLKLSSFGLNFALIFLATLASTHADWADILRDENPRKNNTAPPASRSGNLPHMGSKSAPKKSDSKAEVTRAGNAINTILSRERKELERKMGVILNYMPDTDPDKGVLLTEFAQLYIGMGDFENAEKISLRGIKLAEKAGGKNSQAVIIARSNLSKIYTYFGEYNKSLDIDRMNIETAATNNAVDKRIVAFCHGKLADTLINLGLVEAAKISVEKCLEIASKNKYEREYERMSGPLTILARICFFLGERETRLRRLILDY